MSSPSPASQRTPAVYRIRFLGHLDDRWAAWFDGMTLLPNPDGTSWLDGPVRDQAALYGTLSRLRDLGLTLLDVHRVEPGESG